LAQPADKTLEFDAASVRVNVAGPDGRGRANVNDAPGRLTIVNASLKSIIAYAYHVQPSQVSGPTLLDAEYYDIVASVASAATQDQLRLMLQKLLLERFKLVSERKTQVALAYVLIPGKGSSRLHVSTENGEAGGEARGAALINIKRVTMEKFAELLSYPLKTPVVDMTGLIGVYDFKLDIVPYLDRGDSGGVDETKLDIPTILSQAVEEQLGLKLQQRRVPIMMLVIDHVEKPSEN
jgi:uncharacterized protein (TIGR03435 family)